MSEEKLREFLAKGADWGRMKTSIPGVFVLKLPAYKSSPSRLTVEINPVDGFGNPTKRRGLLIRTDAELEEFRKIVGDDRLSKLQRLMDSINPKGEGTRRDRGEGIIEL